MPIGRIYRVNKAIKKRTSKFEKRHTHKIFWRKTGTRRYEKFRPGFKKPRVVRSFRGKWIRTTSARKKGWKTAKRFGRSRWSPVNLIPKPTDAEMAEFRRDLSRKKSRGGGSKSSPSRTGSPWAPRSRPSSKRKSGQYIRRRRMTKGDSGIRRGARTPTTLPYRKGGCPPGYRYDRRRKMCVRK